MSEVSRILSAIGHGEAEAAGRLLLLVYDDLRKLAAAKLAHLRPGQTLQPTALVHEAYMRLVDTDRAQEWNSRGHFFVAAAEAMRRILVEDIRRKQTLKRGGPLSRRDLEEFDVAAPEVSEDLIALDEALDELEASHPAAAQLVKLRYFSGLTGAEASLVLGIPRRTADRLWSFARFWLLREIRCGQ